MAVLWAGEGLNFSIGRQTLLSDAEFSIHSGERVALVGRNGSGKSTFLHIIAGTETAEGTITAVRGLRTAYMDQDCGRFSGRTVDSVLHDGLSWFTGLHERFEKAKPGSREQEELENLLTLHDAWEPEVRLRSAADQLSLPDGAQLCGSLSGGEMRRVLLARAIISDPDLLLLDEPTNHLDVETIAWIEDFLSGYRGTCLFVTHDRCFLDRIATRIVELDQGKFYSTEGSYADFIAAKEAREYREDQAEYKRQAFLRSEIEWVRRSPKARLRRNEGRLKRYEEIAAEKAPVRIGNMDLLIPPAMRLGNQVVSMKEVSLKMGNKQLFNDFSFEFESGMKVGIAGPNGAGKTTLLKMITGQIQPDKGTVYTAPTVVFNYIAQSRLELNPENSIIEEIGEGHEYINLGEDRVSIRGYLKRFLFEDDRVNTKISQLSGGERARVALAKILRGGGNFLILDEPTNDLDLQTMRVLEESLIHYGGCLAVVSHDRYFLNRICTHVIAFEPDGSIFSGPGDFDFYLEHRPKKIQTASEKKEISVAPRPKQTPKKLSYRENKELEGMEDAVMATENRINGIEKKFSDPDFFAQHGRELPAMQAELNELKTTLDSLYARWDELEKKKEGLENG